MFLDKNRLGLRQFIQKEIWQAFSATVALHSSSLLIPSISVVQVEPTFKANLNNPDLVYTSKQVLNRLSFPKQSINCNCYLFDNSGLRKRL